MSGGQHDYEFALQYAEEEYDRARFFIEVGGFSDYKKLDISRLRSGGYKPQPYPEELKDLVSGRFADH